jgi:hypothetical protein
MSEQLVHTAGTPLPAQPAEITSLVQLAVERGVDVAVLERLVALQERVTERNARAAYFEALAKFQEECPEIRKSKRAKIVSKRTGGQFEYTFAPLEEITRTIRPVLRASGLSYSWDVELAAGALLVTCILRHVDGHSERASFPVPIDKSDRMSEAQSNGAALTYGRRQSLTAVLGLTTADTDIDGGGGHEKPEYITEKEAAGMDDRIEALTANKAKFLEVLGVAKLAEIQKKDLKRATELLDQKAAARAVRANRRPA